MRIGKAYLYMRYIPQAPFVLFETGRYWAKRDSTFSKIPFVVPPKFIDTGMQEFSFSAFQPDYLYRCVRHGCFALWLYTPLPKRREPLTAPQSSEEGLWPIR